MTSTRPCGPGRWMTARCVLPLLLVAPPHARESPTPALAPAPFARLDSVVVAGIGRGLYPGAVVVVGNSRGIRYARGYGHFTWERESPRPSPDSTLFDLASLTKILATTSAVMVLVERGSVDLDAPVWRYLPNFSHPAQAQITVRMLLDHTSGLRAYRAFWRFARSRDSVIAMVYRELPSRPPGQSAVYSDINALLLGLLVESVSGEPLDRFTEREIFQRLGMTQTLFNPPPELRRRCMPTNLVDRRPVSGTVNDLNAAAMHGLAGHAGLFATADDVARYARWWLAKGEISGGPRVSARTMARFLERNSASGSRALGWDTPSPVADTPSVFGGRASASAFGHTGWTGTQLWVDPERDVFVVFLTNRSFAPRTSRSIAKLRSIRAQVADAAMAGMLD